MTNSVGGTVQAPEGVPHEVAKTTENPQHNNTKLHVAVIFFLIVVTVIVAAVVQYHNNKKVANNPSYTAVCSSTTIQSAVSAMTNQQQNQLKQLVSQIQTMKNYQYDPNCLYPVVVSYINLGDPSDAQSFLNKLNKIPNALFYLDDRYKRFGATTTLQQEITALNSTQQQLQSSLKTRNSLPEPAKP